MEVESSLFGFLAWLFMGVAVWTLDAKADRLEKRIEELEEPHHDG